MKKRVTGAWFVVPATVHLVVFAVAPVLYVLWLSLFDWNLLREERPFVGFANFQALMNNQPFWNAMANSAKYALTSVPLGMAVALGVAILVNRPLKAMPVFRTLIYLPAICSGVAMAMLWIYVYLPKTGLINSTLGLFGLPSDTDFLNSVQWAMPALVFMSIWTGLGPRMILYLAGLMNISPTLYEAADIDGASKWRGFWSITLPMLTPTSLFVMVTSTISSFQIFTPVYMMTKGGPLDSTDVVGYHIYTEAWRRFNAGGASAQSFVLLAVIAGVSYLQFKLMKHQAVNWE